MRWRRLFAAAIPQRLTAPVVERTWPGMQRRAGLARLFDRTEVTKRLRSADRVLEGVGILDARELDREAVLKIIPHISIDATSK